MSDQAMSTHILRDKQLSQYDNGLREEWLPETVSNYQVIPKEHAPTSPEQQTWQPQEAEKQQIESQPLPHRQASTPSNANINANVQGRVPNRHSLLFEEWKARSLQSPGQLNDAGFSATAVQKGSNTKTKRSITSGDVRVLLGERFDKPGSCRVKVKPVQDNPGQPELNDARKKETSGDCRSLLVEQTAGVAYVHTNPKMANKDPIHYPRPENLRDRATSKGGKALLREHSDREIDGQATTSSDNDGHAQQTKAAKADDTTTSKDTRGYGRKNSKRGTTVQASISLANNGHSQQSNATTDNANEGHTPAAFSENSNTPIVPPGTSTRKKGSRGIKSRERQQDHERPRSRRRQASHERQSSQGRPATQELRPSKEPQPPQALQSARVQQPSEKYQDSRAQYPSHARQPSREHQGSRERHTYPSGKGFIERKQRSWERPREQAVYTAQNGTRYGVDELRRLAHGVKVSGNVKVYFIPCFIGDPWKDVKPVPCIRPPDLMSRF
ncbi:hypothetical protein BDW67DRAFT_183292 [Aspergillus spinulosporus]